VTLGPWQGLGLSIALSDANSGSMTREDECIFFGGVEDQSEEKASNISCSAGPRQCR
jgi:hypothetical protein